MRKLTLRSCTALPLTFVAVFLAACTPILDIETPPGPLEVGFAKLDLPWRVGAKPGQVGTHALPARDDLFADLVAEVLPILNHPEPETMIPALTEWNLERLGARVSMQPGVYNFVYEPGQGVELPPDVRVTVIRRGLETVALVRADVFIMEEQVHRRVAALVEKETGLKRHQLFISGTHNHSVPHNISPAPGVWTRSDAFDPRQFVYVTRGIADAIIQAHKNLRPAQLRVSKRSFADVQMNIIGPHQIEMRPPEGGALETIQVGYPRDHFDTDLVILRFDDAADPAKPISFIFTYGMHPESLPEGHGITSSEWPRHVEERILAETGVESMWLTGPLGDVEADKRENNPDHHFFRGGFDSMQVMVGMIKEAVLAGYDEAGKAEGDTRPKFAHLSREVPGPEDHYIPDLAEVGIPLQMLRTVHNSTSIPLHVVRIGDVLLMGAPAETTTDLALNIKSRVDRIANNVHQGYVWPDAPAWVRERIANNFSTTELPVEMGAPIPVVINMVNGYIGYIVSRWEYENRKHYRQSMTAFGPGTAEHIATNLMGLVREMEGGSPLKVKRPAWYPLDLQGVLQIQDFLAGLEELVPDLSRKFPASDASAVGTIVETPVTTPTEFIRFGWTGGTNDMEPPAVILEIEDAGAWRELERGPGTHIHVLFSPPDVWTALWRSPITGETLRFRVEGSFRGSTPNISAPHPFWDPDGADQEYSVEGEPFVVAGE
jgi:hypothetical protein